jgi:phage repressor protein C with HTH and peptisase S24 domain
MMPFLHPGEKILVSSIPYLFSNPKAGQIVVFKKNGENMIKRIEKTEGSKVLLRGDNKDDSLRVGWINKDDIAGKLLFKLPTNL